MNDFVTLRRWEAALVIVLLVIAFGLVGSIDYADAALWLTR